MGLTRAASQHRERMNAAGARKHKPCGEPVQDSQPCASVPYLQLPPVRPHRGQARIRRGRRQGRAARRTERMDIDLRKLCRLDGVFSSDEQVIVERRYGAQAADLRCTNGVTYAYICGCNVLIRRLATQACLARFLVVQPQERVSSWGRRGRVGSACRWLGRGCADGTKQGRRDCWKGPLWRGRGWFRDAHTQERWRAPQPRRKQACRHHDQWRAVPRPEARRRVAGWAWRGPCS